MAKLEKPTDLAGWRDYARRLEARASRKITQIERGVYAPAALKPIHEHINPETATRIAHTALDPRKGTSAVARMTKAQVEAHAHRLEEFMAPNVSFFKSGSGKPISAKAMLKYQYSVNRSNEKVRDYVSSVQGTVIPWRGDQQFGKVFDPNRPHEKYGPTSYDMKVHKHLSPKSFQSEESVMRATAKNMEKLTTRYDERSMKGIRDNIRKLIDGSGDSDMYAVLDLPDDVLKLMWTVDSTFANALRFRYEANQDFEEEGDNKHEFDIQSADHEDKLSGKDLYNYGAQIEISSEEPSEANRSSRLRDRARRAFRRKSSR
jgi:terminal protein|nr:MAG TPA: hypothetical protein [Caudoviricetes sp.]